MCTSTTALSSAVNLLEIERFTVRKRSFNDMIYTMTRKIFEDNNTKVNMTLHVQLNSLEMLWSMTKMEDKPMHVHSSQCNAIISAAVLCLISTQKS